jgi:phage FluMu gp28-like protein
MKYKIPVADLIEKLTVDHIKQFKLKKFKGDLENNIKNILDDTEIVLKEKNILLDYKIIRLLIILAQINPHIRNLKDEMKKDSKNYTTYLNLLIS